MEVKLKVVGGAHAGKQIRLTKDRFIIGRAEECHLRANSDLISRRHCAIINDNKQVIVEDFGGRNGTLVNGERVQGQRQLQAGDRLKIGPLEFEIQMSHGIGAPKRAAVKDVSDVAARTAQRKPNVEDNISDWIGSPTGSLSHLVGSTETKTIKTSDTDPDVDDEKPAEEEKPAAEADAGSKSSISKLPKIEKPKAKDSREAAANILREMARRR
ncbi:MAG: FHA domain-containing protein [Planctomycetales bacterium]|nr:FHA domain-containing protein [Planctomycetales bacterium]